VHSSTLSILPPCPFQTSQSIQISVHYPISPFLKDVSYMLRPLSIPPRFTHTHKGKIIALAGLTLFFVYAIFAPPHPLIQTTQRKEQRRNSDSGNQFDKKVRVAWISTVKRTENHLPRPDNRSHISLRKVISVM